jgi:hypothetical protein
MNSFTMEEINLICIYDTSDRAACAAEIRDNLTYVDEPEIRTLMEAVIAKLDGITDADFSGIGLFPTYNKKGG